MSVITPTQIANRALQRVGDARIPAGTLLTDTSKAADEIRACYDMLRRAELRRNVWRFSIRVLALRALNPDMQRVTFGAYASGTTYVQNDVVVASDGQSYYSLAAGNVANNPVSSPSQWALYFGTDIATPFVRAFSLVTTYAIGNLVLGSDNQTYKSLAGGNVGHDPTTDAGVHWALDANNNSGLSFYAGELVFNTTTVYLSLVNGNTTDPVTDTTGSWLTFSTTPSLANVNFIYPIGSGPSSQSSTRNVFILPVGFVREAPQEPKAGSNAFLGGPAGLRYRDWNFENKCITSNETGPILFRFAADVADTMLFDPLFAEGFACRIALEVCEPLTQSTEKMQMITAEYKKFMGEARTVNGIETGPVEPPIDEYIAVRF
jgi:hypothetical protein